MLKIRLRRMGKKHQPFYRVVVSDSRRVPTAPAIEELGHVNPLPTPPAITLHTDRLNHWVAQGAQLSPSVQRLVKAAAAAAKAVSDPAAAPAPAKTRRRTPPPKPAPVAEEAAPVATEAVAVASDAPEAPEAAEPAAEAVAEVAAGTAPEAAAETTES